MLRSQFAVGMNGYCGWIRKSTKGKLLAAALSSSDTQCSKKGLGRCSI